MATHSEHFELIKAALLAAKAEGFILYMDGMEPDEDHEPTLNLWSRERGVGQLDFPSDLWSWN